MSKRAMRVIAGVVASALTCGVLVERAAAWEAGYLVGTFPGITLGLPMGANPPPGVYLTNLGNYGTDVFTGHGTAGPAGASLGEVGAKIDLGQYVPVLTWSTPWTILGATWSMTVIQPMITSSFYEPGGAIISNPAGLHNIILNPFNLSWELAPGFFGALGLDVIPPTGRISGATGLANWGQPIVTIEPRVSFSYLADGWNITSSFRFGVNTANTYTGVTDGAYLHTDLTLAKKFDKWELGAVAYGVNQIAADSNCGSKPAGYCAYGEDVALGGLVGYDFGPASVKVIVTDSVYTRNFAGGWRVYTQLAFPLWVDQPAKPFVAAKF